MELMADKEWQIAQMNELAINNFISKNEDI